MFTGPKIVTDGLVFGYDTGYPVVSGNLGTYKLNRGEPTINLAPTSEEKTGNNEYLPYCRIEEILDTYGIGSGIQFYVSFEAKSPVPGTVVMYTADSLNRKYSWLSKSFQITTEYKKYTLPIGDVTIFDNTKTANRLSFYGTYGTGRIVTVKNLQIERKTHPTPFTIKTRSVSGSLIDLTRTYDIDLSNVSFDSNAQMSFDGTDDYIELNQNLSDLVGNNPSAITFEFIAKADNLTNTIGISGDYTGPYGTGFGIKRSSTGNKLEFRVYATGGIPRSTTDIPLGKYFYGACIWDGTGSGEHKIYFNGVLEKIDTSAGTTWNHGNGNLRIGDIYDSMGSFGEWQGKIPIFKIYNRALTASEILQNYNALKSRFNL